MLLKLKLNTSQYTKTKIFESFIIANYYKTKKISEILLLLKTKIKWNSYKTKKISEILL